MDSRKSSADNISEDAKCLASNADILDFDDQSIPYKFKHLAILMKRIVGKILGRYQTPTIINFITKTKAKRQGANKFNLFVLNVKAHKNYNYTTTYTAMLHEPHPCLQDTLLTWGQT